MSTVRRAVRIAACAATVALTALGVAPTAGVAVGPTVPPVPGPSPTDPPLPDVANDAGDLLVVTGANSRNALLEGDGNTTFSVALPVGATCPGDSANDGWRIQTFIVPAATDVPALEYGATRPDGDTMYALYTTEGRPYTQVLLGQNAEPGLPGLILDFPPMSFAPFTPDLLPVGRYTIGVACSYFEIGERFWDAQIELTEDRDVQPGERRWRVIDPANPSAASNGVAVASSETSGLPTLAIVLLVIVTAAGGASALLIRRRNQPLAEPLAKERTS